MSYGFSAIFEN